MKTEAGEDKKPQNTNKYSIHKNNCEDAIIKEENPKTSDQKIMKISNKNVDNNNLNITSDCKSSNEGNSSFENNKGCDKMRMSQNFDICGTSNTIIENNIVVYIKSELNDTYENLDENTTDKTNLLGNDYMNLDDIKHIKKEIIDIQETEDINDKTSSNDHTKDFDHNIINIKVEFIGTNEGEHLNDKTANNNIPDNDKNSSDDNSEIDVPDDECNNSNDESNIENQQKVSIKTKKRNINSTVKPEKKKKTDQHRCSICSYKCKTSLELKIHSMLHNVKSFKCSQCFKKFKTNNDLVDHKLSHNDDSYRCQSCDAIFENHCDCLVHQIEVHTDALEYTCPECNITYNKKYIRGHIRNHFYNKVQCYICKEMVNKKNINLHISWHNLKFKCPECGHVSKCKKTYDYHMATHTGVNIYQCYYCGEGFKQVSGRNRHMLVHHRHEEHLFECSVCSKKFKKMLVLKQHLARHNSNREVECAYCKKKYKTKTALTSHILQHENKLNSVQRDNSHSLRKHMRKHCKEITFNCDICNLTFKSHQDVENHNSTEIHKHILLKNKMKTEEEIHRKAASSIF